MSSIVAGRFASTADAEEASRKLYARGFSVWDVSIMSLGEEGGVMLAARAKGERRKEATDVMRDAGGKDVEHAEGKWEGGQWVDFASPAEGEPWPAPKSDGHEANDKAVPHPHAKPVAEEAVAPDSTGNEDPGSELEHFVDQQVARHN
jgi:hypothetical protein